MLISAEENVMDMLQRSNWSDKKRKWMKGSTHKFIEYVSFFLKGNIPFLGRKLNHKENITARKLNIIFL